LSNQVREGDYELRISQKNLNIGYKSNNLCYPYNLILHIDPVTDDPIIRYVEPSNGLLLNPKKDLHIEVRFSSPIYNNMANQINRFENTQYLQQSIYLTDRNHSIIQPKNIQTPLDVPIPDDMTRWLFIFSSEHFKSGMEYILLIKYNSLFDESRHPFRQLEDYIYSMRNEDCNGNGQRNNFTGLCNCDEGYKPPSCSECSVGYVFDLKNECKKENSCQVDSCGCLPNKGTNCSPKGTCTPLPRAQIRCNCLYENYTGELCNSCTEGYLKYPDCIKAISCKETCKNGACNNITGTCECEGNWGLPSCDVCISGYSGSNCTVKLDQDSPAIYIILGVIALAIITVAIIFILKNKEKYCSLNQDNDYINIPLTSAMDGEEENKISIEGSDDLEVDFASSSMEEKQEKQEKKSESDPGSEEDKEIEQKEEKLIDI